MAKLIKVNKQLKQVSICVHQLPPPKVGFVSSGTECEEGQVFIAEGFSNVGSGGQNGWGYRNRT